MEFYLSFKKEKGLPTGMYYLRVDQASGAAQMTLSVDAVQKVSTPKTPLLTGDHHNSKEQIQSKDDISLTETKLVNAITTACKWRRGEEGEACLLCAS